MYMIWNVDTAKPVKGGLSYRHANRLANILEGFMRMHYTVLKS